MKKKLKHTLIVFIINVLLLTHLPSIALITNATSITNENHITKTDTEKENTQSTR